MRKKDRKWSGKNSASDIIQYLRCFCEEERIFFLVPTVGRTDYTTARVLLHIVKNFPTIKRAEQV